MEIMEIVITEYTHCDLLQLTGRVDSFSAPQIQTAVEALIQDHRCSFVLDMKDVSFISSSGILTLLNLQKMLQQQNQGEIVFSRVPDLIISSFELAGFDVFFTFFEDVTSAVGKFNRENS